jgi:hypothetical protein
MGNALGGGLQTYGNQQYISSLLKPNMNTGMQAPAGFGTPAPQLNVNRGIRIKNGRLHTSCIAIKTTTAYVFG